MGIHLALHRGWQLVQRCVPYVQIEPVSNLVSTLFEMYPVSPVKISECQMKKGTSFHICKNTEYYTMCVIIIRMNQFKAFKRVFDKLLNYKNFIANFSIVKETKLANIMRVIMFFCTNE